MVVDVPKSDPPPPPITPARFFIIATTALDALEKYAQGHQPLDTELVSWLNAVEFEVSEIRRTDPLLK